MKEKDLLMLGVGGLAAWFLLPEKVKENFGGSGGGFNFNLEGIIPESPFNWGQFNEILSARFSELPNPNLADSGGLLTGLDDFLNAFKNLLPTFPTTPPPGTTKLDTPNAWEWFTGLNPIVQNVAGGLGLLTGSYFTFKAVQATSPVAQGTAGVINRWLKGFPKTKTIPKITTLKMPVGTNPKLWLQWLKRTNLSQFKNINPMLATTSIAVWLNEFLLTGGAKTVYDPYNLPENATLWASGLVTFDDKVKSESQYLPLVTRQGTQSQSESSFVSKSGKTYRVYQSGFSQKGSG